jgi:hypothetical protein
MVCEDGALLGMLILNENEDAFFTSWSLKLLEGVAWARFWSATSSRVRLFALKPEMNRLGECFSDVDFKTPEKCRRQVIPYFPGDATSKRQTTMTRKARPGRQSHSIGDQLGKVRQRSGQSGVNDDDK